MKFLIAGLGSIGRRHLRNLRALGEQDILLYRTHTATLPEDELAGLPVETDLAAALAHRPDAVIVSNPSALHLDVAIPAAEAGCHLLLEKPISHSMDRVDELFAAVQRNNVRVLVGFQFRFHPALNRIAELLAESAIGRPVSARAYWGEYLPDWHPWEDYRQSYSARPDLGGGAILTLCHPLDYLRWLIGDVAELWAFTSNIGLNLEVEDTAEIGLQFASGATAFVHLDFVQRPHRHELEIIGAEGTIRWDYANGGMVELFRSSSNRWESIYTAQGFERNDMFLAEMHHFREVVKGAADPRCPLADGLAALELALAALRSGKEGRTVAPRSDNQ